MTTLKPMIGFDPRDHTHTYPTVTPYGIFEMTGAERNRVLQYVDAHWGHKQQFPSLLDLTIEATPYYPAHQRARSGRVYS